MAQSLKQGPREPRLTYVDTRAYPSKLYFFVIVHCYWNRSRIF